MPDLLKKKGANENNDQNESDRNKIKKSRMYKRKQKCVCGGGEMESRKSENKGQNPKSCEKSKKH